MKTELLTDLTVADICKGFVYNELEGKGLFGWGGRLTIQPEFQRNYIYAENKKDVAVIQSLMLKYPLGLIYFLKVGEDRYEVLDGQQRITSFGRFVTGKFAVKDANGRERNIDGLDDGMRERILNTKLTVYVCEGEGDDPEGEIKEWFKIINMNGIELNEQELLNATYSGPFVTAAKAEFSNSRNANLQRWKNYVSGSEKRQDILREALRWVSRGNIDGYMARHRRNADISELKEYFNAVIDWADSVFAEVKADMRGLDWGRLYETYHNQPYDAKKVWERVLALYAKADEVEHLNTKGIFEYILGGEKNPQLLDVRLFDKKTMNAAYARQTQKANREGVSNCPLCAVGNSPNRTRIYPPKEMDADHITAWTKGGATTIENCQMLCRTHNRAKGNR